MAKLSGALRAVRKRVEARNERKRKQRRQRLEDDLESFGGGL